MTPQEIAASLGLSEYAARSIAERLDALDLVAEGGERVPWMAVLAAFAEVLAEDELDALMLDGEQCFEA